MVKNEEVGLEAGCLFFVSVCYMRWNWYLVILGDPYWVESDRLDLPHDS